MIKWSPEERIEAVDALKHPFILDGLPKQVRSEHLRQMNSGNPYNLYWLFKCFLSYSDQPKITFALFLVNFKASWFDKD